MLRLHTEKKVIVFVNSAERAVKVEERLQSVGFAPCCVHEELPPSQRCEVIRNFPTSSCKISLLFDFLLS